jgi:hypothetical protein
MFVLGLVLQGRLFPFDLGRASGRAGRLRQRRARASWIAGRAFGLGNGIVTAVTYEYGNTFLIVAGLLNFLVMLDAYDIGAGRK